MTVTVLYPEDRQIPDLALEQEIFGPDVRLIRAAKPRLAELDPADCAAADGLMIMRWTVTAADLDRFQRLRCVVRMGVGYDKLDRKALAGHNILVCNVPDYGTTEVADHALALTLRRGILLRHELQRRDPPAPWRSFHHPMIRRLGVQNFGIIGLGRIGTAVALRAKAFNFRVLFYDPYLPNGVELALGIDRAASLEELLRQTDTLSIHTPLTPETPGFARPCRARPAAAGRGCDQRCARTDPRSRCAVDASKEWTHRRRGARRIAGRAAGRAGARAVAPLSGARALARRSPNHHPARRLADSGVRDRHATEVGRDNARRAADQPAAKRHHARDVLSSSGRS
jgi:hypothetical protein